MRRDPAEAQTKALKSSSTGGRLPLCTPTACKHLKPTVEKHGLKHRDEAGDLRACGCGSAVARAGSHWAELRTAVRFWGWRRRALSPLQREEHRETPSGPPCLALMTESWGSWGWQGQGMLSGDTRAPAGLV